MQRKNLYSAVCGLFFLLACLLPGCGKSSLGEKDRQAGFYPQGSDDRLPGPLNAAGITIVPRGEAERLAAAFLKEGSAIPGLDFAAAQSLAHLSGLSAEAVLLDRPGLRLTCGRLRETLLHLRFVLPRLKDSPELLADEFTWYRIGPDFGITGYYEPTLNASRTPTSVYRYPLYRLPPDWKKGTPYLSRRAIDREGKLAGKGLELVWVDSDVDAFFLHVQGSGRLLFADKSVRHILFAGHNNLQYTSLGRIMRDQGLLAKDDINMQSIRAVLAEKPELKTGLFDQNQRYVFFREAESGPIGAMGYPLTPWVSAASDRATLPHGALAFLAVNIPDYRAAKNSPGKNGQTPFFGPVLPQDVGGAIKGNRLDLFCGAGPAAEYVAGRLDSRGAVYILVKK